MICATIFFYLLVALGWRMSQSNNINVYLPGILLCCVGTGGAIIMTLTICLRWLP